MAGVRTEVKPSYGPRCRGKVRFNQNEVKAIAETGDVYEFTYDDLGPNVIQKNQKDSCFSMSADEETLTFIGPWEGSFICEFVGFVHEREEDEDGNAVEGEPRVYTAKGGPRQRTIPGSNKVQKWVAPDRDKFTGRFEIKSVGPWKGYFLNYWVDYVFARDTDGSTKLYGSRSGWIERAENFLDVVGWDRDSMSIPFSDNVLTHIEPVLLEVAPKNHVMVSVENGWTDSLDRPATGTS